MLINSRSGKKSQNSHHTNDSLKKMTAGKIKHTMKDYLENIKNKGIIYQNIRNVNKVIH